MKLRTKIFLIFTAIAVFPLAFLTAFTYYQYVHITSDRMSSIISSQFRNISDKAETSYNTVRQAFQILAFYSEGNYSIMNMLNRISSAEELSDYELYELNNEMNSACQNVIYTYNDIYGIYVFTPSGNLIGHSTGQNGSISYEYNPTLDPWYSDTLDLEGKIYTSGLGIHSMFQANQQSIFFAQSVRNIKTHENLGVIVLDCSPKLFDLEGANALGTSNLITLWDNTNKEILFTNRGKTDSDFSSSQNPVLKSSVPDSSLELALVFDYNSLIAEFLTTGVLLLFFSIFCIIGLIILTYKISNSLIYPIQQLSRQMVSQRTAHLSLLPDYSYRKDEIGILYRQYNSMIEELNASIKKDYQDKLILLDAQMKSLEARINSHFLFNTLESINSMAELEDNGPIATMSLALGNMFRYAVKTESELVTLQEELNHVYDYTAIQKIRFDNRFYLSLDIPQELRKQKVLKLILQPLVENSLSHGLNYCTCGDEINITARAEDSYICLSVSDNGQGIPKKQLKEIQDFLSQEASFSELGHRNKQSIGLKNIQSRIELYYGKGYGISINSEAGKGTKIMIKIPIIVQKEEHPDVHLSYH